MDMAAELIARSRSPFVAEIKKKVFADCGIPIYADTKAASPASFKLEVDPSLLKSPAAKEVVDNYQKEMSEIDLYFRDVERHVGCHMPHSDEDRDFCCRIATELAVATLRAVAKCEV